MEPLTCDICGGRLKIGKGKIAVCESCGTEHSLERMQEKVREIKGTVRIDNAHLVDNFFSMAQDAFSTENYAEAERYCNKVLEIDPKHSEAALLKGRAVGQQSSLTKIRLKEAAKCFSNAFKAAEVSEIRENIIKSVASEFENLATALISTRCDRFQNWQNAEETEGFYRDLDEMDAAISLYEKETGIAVNRNQVFVRPIGILRIVVLMTFCAIVSKYKQDGSRNAYYEFIQKANYCVQILEKAVDLCDNDEPSDLKSYELIVSMLQTMLAHNAADTICDKWGAYKRVYRLSDDEEGEMRKKIEVAQAKIEIIKES